MTRAFLRPIAARGKTAAETERPLTAVADRTAERPAIRADLADDGADVRFPGILVGVDVLLGQARVQQLRIQVTRDPARAPAVRLLLHGRVAGPGRSGQAERREHLRLVRRRTGQDRDRKAVLRRINAVARP